MTVYYRNWSRAEIPFSLCSRPYIRVFRFGRCAIMPRNYVFSSGSILKPEKGVPFFFRPFILFS